ncbi:MFS transporter [Pyruvatibacter sp.]|uniref:MFS transporter n=1 Tax=unclassified Pyruvatibacter TaxID=2618840 RepID=UPI0032677383
MTDATQTPSPAPSPNEARWYMTGHVAYFLATGIQGVLISWLVTIVLAESPERVGIAQMFSMLPMLVFIMVGGAAADRAELRSHLVRLQVFLALPSLVLAATILSDSLNYWVVLAYVGVMSTTAAWIVPARDSLLTRIAMRSMGGAIPHAVAMATAAQFAAQVIGMLVAAAAGLFGAVPYLVFHSAMSLLTAFSTSRLDEALPTPRGAQKHSRFKEMMEGMSMTLADPDIRAIMILMGIGGIFYIGVFMVIFPLLARDVYGGGALEIALFTSFFFGGIGASSFVLTRLPEIKRQGRAIMLAMCMGSVTMTLVHFQPPLWLVLGLVLIWGMSAGVSMSTARAIVQARAPDSHRGRMLAAFQVAMMGGGPVGSLLAGYVASKLGLFDAILVPPAFMVVLWLGVFFFTDLWKADVRSVVPQPAD